MALDFYEIDDTRQRNKLFSIDNKQMDLMDDIFMEFKKLTGNYVDPYGRNRIYKEHVELIMSIIKKHLNTDPDKEKIRSLSKIYEEFSESRNGLFAIGD